MVEFIYTISNILISPILLLNLIYRLIKGKEDPSRITERLGFSRKIRPKGKLIWIHAASVGEAMSIAHLINAFYHKNYKILLTTGTKSSAKIVDKKYKQKVIHQYIPLENYFAIKFFFKKWNPDIALFVESEFWPIIIYQANKYVEVLSINTSISDSTYKNWQIFRILFKDLLSRIKFFYPKSKIDLAKLNSYGLNNTKYYGNLKYSVKPLSYDESLLERLQYEIGQRKVIMAFSTHDPEEELLFNLFKKLNNQFPDLLLIIAPRHPERTIEIEDSLKKLGLKYAIRSKGQKINKDISIYLADTLGELSLFFSLVKINIVGGSFTSKINGHNPIEAALMKSICIMGPYHSNFTEIVEEFTQNNAIIVVKDINEAEKELACLLKNDKLVDEYTANAQKLVSNKAQLISDLIIDLEKNINAKNMGK